ncbi:MAG: DUF3540 domain-containing protein [Thermodesulfobacteriota bacterium]
MQSTKQSPARPPVPSLEYGRVLSAAPGRFLVETSFAEVEAARAVSCLVEPACGDKVLLAVDLSGGAWILSVLESAGTVNLAVDGDARLSARGGTLTIASDRDVSLACPGAISAVSGELSVHASSCSAVIEKASLAGRALRTQFKRVRQAAASVDQMFRRFTQRSQESSRFVKEHDEVQAGSRRVLVEELCALHARNHSMMAEEHVVINADQIHMG